MSNTVFTSKLVVARKDYRSAYSDTFDFLITKSENGKLIVDRKEIPIGMIDEEINLIQSCIDNKWLIKKGELHYYSNGIYDGEMYTARAPKGIHEICCKYDLYTED